MQSDFKIICITARQLLPGCTDEALATRVADIVRAGADAVVLREKDLAPAKYARLAAAVYQALAAADAGADAPGQRPLDALGQRPLDALGQRPLDAPGQRPLDAPGQRPLDAPAKRPLDALGQRPALAPARRPLDALGQRLVLHTFADVAADLGCRRLHLPLALLAQYKKERPELLETFDKLAASVHSIEEARYAESLGATAITAGHVFTTDCKKGLAPRGTDFLASIVKSVDIPVYGIGGIGPQNIAEIRETGAAGACIMSDFMRCDDPAAYMAELKRRIL